MNREESLFVRLASIAVLLVISLTGCTHIRQAVTPLPNRDVIALDADAVVRIMRRAGFSDEQILDLGTDLRNSLALTGAARVQIGKKTEAIFAVHAPYLHASSRQRGSFIYNVKTGEIH